MSNRNVWDISVDDLPDDTPSAPVPQLPENWYLSIEGTVHGPYPQRDIYSWVQNNSLSWDTLASRGRSDGWRALRNIEEFCDPKRPFGGTPPPPPEWLNGPQQQRAHMQPVAAAKSPVLAAVLNSLLMGAGYLYLGQTTKSIVTFVIGIPVGVIFIILTAGIGIFLWWIVLFITGIDAYMIGQKMQRGEAVGEWDLFPS